MPISTERLVRCLAVVAIATATLNLAGCSRATGTVTGTVKYGDKVLKGGNVTFMSTEGQPSQSAAINEDGTYTVQKITAGSYKVCVETASLRPKPAIPGGGAGTGAKSGGVKAAPLEAGTAVPAGYTPSNMAEAAIATANAKNAKLYVAIPDQFGDPGKTTLTCTVVGGEQKHDIEFK